MLFAGRGTARFFVATTTSRTRLVPSRQRLQAQAHVQTQQQQHQQHQPWSAAPYSGCGSCGGARRFYFTDADRMRREDPYAVLGLTYGDGCTVAEIKAAFRRKAKQLHPDVVVNNNSHSETRTTRRNQHEFLQVLKAYETLTKIHTNLPGLDASKDDEWKMAVWRRGDRIAVHRTDVAGVRRVRPVPSPSNNKTMAYVLGHPQRGGIVSASSGRGEYLEQSQSDGKGGAKRISTSSVGRGQSKWVTRRTPYTPWKKDDDDDER